MKLWRFADPSDQQFAEASRRGTWSPSSGLCSECGASSQERIQPLVLEWEPGSDVIGDFTWPGFGSDIAIAEKVVTAFKGFGGFEPGPVEMVQDPNQRRQGGPHRGKPRVWLPYQGPPLYDLWVTRQVHLDLERSSVWLVKECRTCGRQQYAVDGIERRETRWDKEQRKSVRMHIPRSRGLGFYVAEDAFTGSAIFRTHEFPGWVLCTDLVKEIVEKEGFTNVSFLEVGDTT
ncbi:MAG: hypothetical protein ACREA0_06825 [bacterium]